MLNKKQIQVILFEFKCVIKQQRQLERSTTHLDQELLANVTVQWWFKKFCKEDWSLKDEESSCEPSEVDNGQLRAIIEANPLKTTQVAKELNVDHCMVIWHLKQIGK